MENDKKISQLGKVSKLTGEETVPFARKGTNGSFDTQLILDAIPTKMSELTDDQNYVRDDNYVHTDNNFTTLEKEKLQGLENYDDTALRETVNALSSDVEELKNVQNIQNIAWGVPIKQDLQSGTDYGFVGNRALWEEYKRMCGRYLVTNDGRAAKLSPTNSELFADGTPVDETLGHVMWIGPRLYFRVQNADTNGSTILWMSRYPIGGHYIGGANGRMYNCIGAYKGSMSGSALVSRSGVAPARSKTINAFWSAAQMNGKDWGLSDYDQRKLMMILGLSEYGDTNIQAKLGYGICGSVNKNLWDSAALLQTGATKSLGDNWGKIDISLVNGSNTGVDCSRVNIMGIEDPYGWMWEDIQGVYCGKYSNSAQDGLEIFIYKGNRLPSSAELVTHPEGEYRQATRVTASGWVQKIIAGDNFDILSTKIGGDSTSYWTDYSWADNIGQLVFCGGSASDGTHCGWACTYSCLNWSDSVSAVGSRLAFYGDLTFVDRLN